MAFQNTRSFSFTCVGSTTKETFSGDFDMKIFLSDGEEFARDARYRELLGASSPTHATQEVTIRAWMLADLFVRLTKAPSFWSEANGLNLLDKNVAKDLYEDCKKAVDAETAKIAKKGERAEAELKADQAKG